MPESHSARLSLMKLHTHYLRTQSVGQDSLDSHKYSLDHHWFTTDTSHLQSSPHFLLPPLQLTSWPLLCLRRIRSCCEKFKPLVVTPQLWAGLSSHPQRKLIVVNVPVFELGSTSVWLAIHGTSERVQWCRHFYSHRTNTSCLRGLKGTGILLVLAPTSGTWPLWGPYWNDHLQMHLST